MSIVLDCSAVLAWVYAEETTPAVHILFELLVNEGAWVPSLWHLEVANVLLSNARRGRHDMAFCRTALADLEALPIAVDTETEAHAWQDTMHIAEMHRLSVYDAAYLELARRRGIALATLDVGLRTAAAAESVPLLGL